MFSSTFISPHRRPEHIVAVCTENAGYTVEVNQKLTFTQMFVNQQASGIFCQWKAMLLK